MKPARPPEIPVYCQLYTKSCKCLYESELETGWKRAGNEPARTPEIPVLEAGSRGGGLFFSHINTKRCETGGLEARCAQVCEKFSYRTSTTIIVDMPETYHDIKIPLLFMFMTVTMTVTRTIVANNVPKCVKNYFECV